MTPEALERIKRLVEAYDDLPCVMGKKAQEAACLFINENHAGFKDLKSLLDGYKAMREALNFIAMYGEGDTMVYEFGITPADKAKQTLGDNDEI